MSDQEDVKYKKSVLFVCLGNICRSPMAHAVFIDILNKNGMSNEWKVDSCAIGPWHIGDQPDPRCISTLVFNGIGKFSHVVRQISTDDFKNFYYIFGMDSSNMKRINELCPHNFKGKLALLGSYDHKNTTQTIPDPYYQTNDKGFKSNYVLIKQACLGFLEQEKFLDPSEVVIPASSP